MAALFEKMKKPDRPLPVESMSANESFDLIIDPNLTIENGMPIHRKADFGGVDSKFSYENGHLMLARSFDLNGSAIEPQNWAAFIDFMRTAETDTARSFALERNAPSTSARLPPLNQSLEEGDSAYRRHDYEAAKRAYLEATKLDTQNRSEAWNSLGRVYSALHEYGKAESAYQRQIEINPKDLYAYNNLGVTYRAMKREGDAIASFRKEIAINPRDRFAHDNLAVSLAAANSWEEARVEEEIAVEISPEDVTKRVRLGRAQVKTGRIDEAAKNFDQALARPHDAMVENNIAYYMTEGGMDLKRAWQLVSGALNPAAKTSCNPEKLAAEDECAVYLTRLAHMLDTAGWVLYRQGKVAESEPYLSSAFAISPHAETETHYATVLARLGRVDESLRCLADASSLTGFTRADATEVRRELAKAIGGEAVLDSRLKQIQTDRPAADATVHVRALVDEHGKVLDARSLEPSASDAVIREAKALALMPISWPDHSMRSVRTIELHQGAGKWSAVRSYVGQAAEQVSAP
jgi:tetratricopeptide (TPR) repeat protein